VPAEPLPVRRRRRVAPPLAAAAAVLALVAVGVVIGHVSAGQHPAGASPLAPGSAAPGTVPAAASAYRLVGPVNNLEALYLDCVTASVCYAWLTGSSSPEPVPSERTSDGGAAWQPIAGLPGGAALFDVAQPSCPTAEVCAVVTGEPLTLAMTTDGGASWRLDHLPVPPGGPWGDADQVSCATAQECVVHITGGEAGTFLSTTDGGQTWTDATEVPGDAPPNLQLLRCDPSGHCIGAASAGLGTASVPGQGPGVKIVRSADHGLTWTASSTGNVPSESVHDSGGFLMSCGDALHCMYAAGSGVAVTSDGGVTWQQPATPAAWQGSIISAVSCAEDLDCSVALAPVLVGSVPVIEATSDGMTWTAQSLPSTSSDPLQYISMLSCPSPGGCIGLGSTLSQDEAAFAASQGFDNGMIETSPQLEFSSLGGS
jgi:hypothetical protein